MTLPKPLWALLSLLAAAALLLASPLGGPVVAHVTDSIDHLTGHLDQRYVKQKLLKKRAMCAGFDFYPHGSDIPYGTTEALRHGGPGYFRCGIALPEGGTITGLQIGVRDFNSSGKVGKCALALVRVDKVSGFGVGGYATIADITGTGIAAEAGDVELKTANINQTHALINDEHAYWVECYVGANTNDLGIYGAAVTYTIERGE